MQKTTTDAIETATKRAIQKTPEAIGDLIGNKMADNITSVSKISSRELQNLEANNEIEKPQERYISPKKGNMLSMNYD